MERLEDAVPILFRPGLLYPDEQDLEQGELLDLVYRSSVSHLRLGEPGLGL